MSLLRRRARKRFLAYSRTSSLVCFAPVDEASALRFRSQFLSAFVRNSDRKCDLNRTVDRELRREGRHPSYRTVTETVCQPVAPFGAGGATVDVCV